MSHEKSITVERDGRHYNLDNVGPDKGRQLGRSYATNDNAVAAAKVRSRNYDPETNRQTDEYGRARTVKYGHKKKRKTKGGLVETNP